MEKETITSRQAICMLILFMLGSSLVMGFAGPAEQDTWISLILGAAGFVPVALIYSRITRLFPEKGIFEIVEALFGKIPGKILTLLMCWYAIHLGSLVMRNFSEFIVITVMQETPQLAVMILIVLVAVYLAKSGAEALGKWSVAVLPVLLLAVISTMIMSLDIIDLSNLLPVFEHDAGTIVSASYPFASFPLMETVLFLGAAGAIKRTDSAKKIYIAATLISLGILLTMMVRNVGLLGVPLWKVHYFPSYAAARIIKVSDYLARIEGSVAVNFIFTGVTKATVCLLFASKGIASVFGIKDYKQSVLPAGLLMLALCAIVYRSTMEMFDFLKVYPYYAAPFQLLIPLVIWITAEIRTRRGKLLL